MKKHFILVILLVFVLSSCSQTFNGYSYNLEDARRVENCYNEHDYLFTVEQEGAIVDFVINGDLLHIIIIDCQKHSSNTLYRVKSHYTSMINENTIASEDGQETYFWAKTGNYPYPLQVEWLITSKEFYDSHQDYTGFNFIYNDTEYVLCYQIY